jgi:hypothetical protein
VLGKWGPGYGYGIANKYLPADGFIQADYSASEDTTALLGLSTDNNLEDFQGFDYSIYVQEPVGTYFTSENNVFTNTGVTAVIGDKFRLSRTGSTIRAQYSRTNGQTWVTLRTFPVTTSANLYIKATIPTTSRYLLNPKGYQTTDVTATTSTSSSSTTTTTTSGSSSTTSSTTTKKLVLTLTSKKNVSCRNGSDGSIKVSASGGIAPYQYKLNAGSYGVSRTFSGLSSAKYTVTAKDSTNAVATITVTIYNGFFRC